jgi:glycosyltransferase involved in cell wall biosynthesis
MKLSILIPCYNEVNTILEIIKKIENNYKDEFEIIIIDDFSTDGTREKLRKLQQSKLYKIIFNDRNYGKGFSIRQGIKFITGEITLIQDADLEYDPSDYVKLLKPIKDGVADVVYGSRFVGSAEKRVFYFWHRLGNFFLTFLSNIFANINLTDMECCYKLFKTDIIKKLKLKENRFGFEPEVTAKISKLDLRIYEVGVKYNGRKYIDGKKITWKDGISAIYCIFKYNLFD